MVSDRSTKRQHGQAVVLFSALIGLVIVPMVGLAVDGLRMYLVRAKLAAAVDGGAIAAARLLASGADSATQTNNATATARQFVQANFPTGFFGARLESGQPSVCVDLGDGSDPCNLGTGGQVDSYKKRQVVVSARADVPTTFMRVAGFNSGVVAASGRSSRRDVRVVLAIDRSSSMGAVIGAVKTQAQDFVNKFSPARDEVGLVVFGGSAVVAYPPRDSTKDPTQLATFQPPNSAFSPTVVNLISKISSGSNTGTAEALYLSHMTLRADAATNATLANKLNVIVLFTDGLPNGVTVWANRAGHNVVGSSTCANKSSATKMIGWLSQQQNFNNTPNGGLGLFTPMMTTEYPGKSGNDLTYWMQNAGTDGTVISAMSGCTCKSNSNRLSYDMSAFPDIDLYGNRTGFTGGTPPWYKSGDLFNNYGRVTQDLSRVDRNYEVGLASWNATADQAWKIWNGKLYNAATDTIINDPNPINPVIFTIGYGHDGEPPDLTLLKIIANSADSPVTVATGVHGKYYYATSSDQVGQAFAQIASEILRLAQ